MSRRNEGIHSTYTGLRLPSSIPSSFAAIPGKPPREWLFASGDELGPIVARDLAELTEAGRKPTAGDTRCIIFGHLTRMTIWNLRDDWDTQLATDEKLGRFAQAACRLADPEKVLDKLESIPAVCTPAGPLFFAATAARRTHDAVAF